MKIIDFDYSSENPYLSSYLALDLEIPVEIFKRFSIEQYNYFDNYHGYRRTVGYKFVAMSKTCTIYLESNESDKQSAIAIHSNGNISEMTIN